VPVTLSAPWPELCLTVYGRTTSPLAAAPCVRTAGKPAAHLCRGQRQFLAELRPAVTLFLRFAGLDYDGDDAAGEKLDRYICWAQRVLARYDGYLLQLTVGDKGSYFYAVFGAPIAHDDDGRGRWRRRWRCAQPPAEFAAISPPQIGISQGRMRTGAYGGDMRQTYGVLGDEVNTSARLMELAQPGQILLSIIWRSRCRAIMNAAAGTETASGKQAALAVCELAGRRVMQERPSAIFSHRLVGREADLDQMRTVAETVLAGQGQIIAAAWWGGYWQEPSGVCFWPAGGSRWASGWHGHLPEYDAGNALLSLAAGDTPFVGAGNGRF
jgi:class 3 adenylate cyclase